MQSGVLNHSAHLVLQQVMSQIQAECLQYFNALNASKERILSALLTTHPTSNVTPVAQANALSSDNVLNNVAKTLKEVKNELKKLPSFANKKEEVDINCNMFHNCINCSKYCWSCGAWNHLSKDCTWHCTGHKNNTTFQNMMGGSTAYCQPVTS